MNWFLANFGGLMTCCLILSEAAAAIVQLAYPNNQGITGVIAGLIKLFQSLGGKNPPLPPSA